MSSTITRYVLIDSDGVPGDTYMSLDDAVVDASWNTSCGVPTAVVEETWVYVDDDRLVYVPGGYDAWPLADPIYTR